MWTVKLTPTATRQLKRLEKDIQRDAVDVLLDLEDGIFPPDKIQLRKHERYERVKFAGDQFRIIYRIDKEKKVIVVTRIRPRNAKTYEGF